MEGLICNFSFNAETISLDFSMANESSFFGYSKCQCSLKWLHMSRVGIDSRVERTQG